MTENNQNIPSSYTPGAVPPMPSSQGTRPTSPEVMSAQAAAGAGTPVQPGQPGQYTAAQATGYAQPNAQFGVQGQPVQPNPNPQHAAKAAPSKKFGPRTFLYGFAGAAVACLCAFGVAGAVGSVHAAENTATPAANVTLGAQNTTAIDVDGEDITLPEAVASKCLPSVAYVATYVDASAMNPYSNQYGYGYGDDYGYGYGDPYGYGYGDGNGYGYGYGSPFGGLEDLFGQNSAGTEVVTPTPVAKDGLTEYGSGSGVVLSADGYIVTNNHVVEGGSAWTVTINGKTYDCDLVGTDPSSDIAVLKAKDVDDLTPMEIADSNDIEVGEWVMTIGSPFGLETSVATGIVSATNRSQLMSGSESGSATDTMYPNMIQTDAAINPGNSGGALVDAQGRLIGINTLIISYSSNYSGVGFAIPSNYGIGIAEQIINGEELSYAQLGVSLQNASEVGERYNLGVDEGAYIAAVVPDSPAAKAGLVEGDIITAFNGKPVTSASDLMLDVRGEAIGSTVELTVERDGQTQTIEVTLGSSANGNQQAQQQEQPQQPQQR